MQSLRHQVNIRLFGHLRCTELRQVVFCGLHGLMAQGLADDFDGLVLIFQRHGEAVTGGIDCNVLLTLRKLQLLGNLLQGGVETLAYLHKVLVQFVRRTASNIGSEDSALDNAFMFSLIESCKLNDLVPEKYIAHLLRQLRGEPTEKDKAALLPCCCAL